MKTVPPHQHPPLLSTTTQSLPHQLPAGVGADHPQMLTPTHLSLGPPGSLPHIAVGMAVEVVDSMKTSHLANFIESSPEDQEALAAPEGPGLPEQRIPLMMSFQEVNQKTFMMNPQ